MMYICGECGMIFDEIAHWEESRGEFWGQPAYERMSGCPYCHSTDFDEYDPDAENDEDEESEDGEDDDGREADQ